MIFKEKKIILNINKNSFSWKKLIYFFDFNIKWVKKKQSKAFLILQLTIEMNELKKKIFFEIFIRNTKF